MAEKIVIGLMVGVGGIAVVVALSALLALPVMWLWNGVGPNLFAAEVTRPINFWNAWGLALLCGLLFKGSGSSSSGN